MENDITSVHRESDLMVSNVHIEQRAAQCKSVNEP